jgi:peptidoglycan/LPS O-acetylase OafA/YrhL
MTTSCKHPTAATKRLVDNFFCTVRSLQIWSQTPDALYNAAALNWEHLIEQALGALGSAAAQVAFAAFCTHQLTRPGQAKALGSRFVGLQFVLSGFLLTWHYNTPKSYKIPRLAGELCFAPTCRGAYSQNQCLRQQIQRNVNSSWLTS